jgi:hypothetical protein
LVIDQQMGRITEFVMVGILGVAIGYYTFDQPLRVSALANGPQLA